jgi:hypothetical protein
VEKKGESGMSNDKSMAPMTGEMVETDGIYANEAGREVTLKRGEIFPADLILGQTTWEMKALPMDEALLEQDL